MVKLTQTIFLFIAFLGAAQTWAVCNFDSQGTISNPNDPACKDARFTYTENNNAGNNIALGFNPPQPMDSLTPVDGFRSYESLFARHQDLLLQYPHVSGQVIGQTVNGRDIWAYSLSDSDATTLDGSLEGAALLNGGIHAREWQSPEAMTGLFEYMAENKNLRNIDNGMSIDQEIATSDDNFFGVDLNRNQASGFANPQRSSSNQVSLIHRGPNPQSEPESQALADAADLGPADRLRFYIHLPNPIMDT